MEILPLDPSPGDLPDPGMETSSRTGRQILYHPAARAAQNIYFDSSLKKVNILTSTPQTKCHQSPVYYLMILWAHWACLRGALSPCDVYWVCSHMGLGWGSVSWLAVWGRHQALV